MAAPTVDLPQDLIEDILSRLPVKSLLRFRCVHKSWYSLFKSSSFITSHFQNPNNKDRSGFVYVKLRPGQKSKLEFRFTSLSRDTLNVCSDFASFVVCLDFVLPFRFYSGVDCHFAGSCNGLACLALSQYVCGIKFILFNFSLNQYKVISESNRPPVDPARSEAYAFGYDSKNNDYKVVRIVFWLDDIGEKRYRREADVYTLGLNSWRKGVTLPDVDYFNYFTKAYLNGAIHWFGMKNKRGCVICFDLSSEVFQQFPLPDCFANRYYIRHIDVYGDLLSLVGWDCGRFVYDIWVMREYGVHDSWVKLHSVQTDLRCTFVGFGINRELVSRHSRGVIVYYPDKEVKKITFDQLICSTVVPYMESLVSLEEDN